MEHLYCPILGLGQIVDMIEPSEDFRNLSLQVSMESFNLYLACSMFRTSCVCTYVIGWSGGIRDHLGL